MTMRKFLSGLAVILAALWGGSFLALRVFPQPSWQNGPVIITALLVAIAGLVILFGGVKEPKFHSYDD
jgi:drug/metabolite transporter (DMT)-like permease